MTRLTWLLLAGSLAGSLGAPEPARPDPREPTAAVPQIVYRSAFDHYRRYGEPELMPWRQTNEEMARLGGHQGHVPQQIGKEPADRAGGTAKVPHGDRHGGRK